MIREFFRLCVLQSIKGSTYLSVIADRYAVEEGGTGLSVRRGGVSIKWCDSYVDTFCKIGLLVGCVLFWFFL